MGETGVTKLVMIMGLQRSGTTALFDALSRDPAYDCYQESRDNEAFLGWRLRPEPEIRELLTRSGRPVLMKPIDETNHRDVNAVLEEFGDYEVWIPWIYRDPVDNFFSTIDFFEYQHQTSEDFYSSIPSLADPLDAADEFIRRWNDRNRCILEAGPQHAGRIAIIRYEDLIQDAGVFTELCRFLSIRGEYVFRASRAWGRKSLPLAVEDKIDAGTRAVREALDARRRFSAEPRIGMRLARRYYRLKKHVPQETRDAVKRLLGMK